MTAALTSRPKAPRHIVKIGEAWVTEPPTRIETILGSCLGIILVWRELPIYGLAHVLLPNSGDDRRRPSRYADTAPQFLLDQMGVPPDQYRQVRAVLAGGAGMFESEQTRDVGLSNQRAVRQALRSAGVRVLGTDVGGSHARRMAVDTRTGVATSIRLDTSEVTKWKLFH